MADQLLPVVLGPGPLSPPRGGGPRRPGATVELHGLEAATALNGQRGTLHRYDAGKGCWQVDLPGVGVKAIKPSNFVCVEAPAEVSPAGSVRLALIEARSAGDLDTARFALIDALRAGDLDTADRRLALIEALSAGDIDTADLLSPSSEEWHAQIDPVDLTVADALQVFLHEPEVGVVEFFLNRVDGVLSALIASLEDRGLELARKWTAATLGKLGERAAPAVPALINCINGRDSDVIQAAADALAKLGKHAEPAVPSLTKRIAYHVDGQVRSSAADALGRLGEHAAPAVPALIKYLEHPDGYVRKPAADALGELGEHAKAAVPSLKQCLMEYAPRITQVNSGEVQRSVALALCKLGQHTDAVSGLAQLMKHKNTVREDVRGSAVDTLGMLGEYEASATALAKCIAEGYFHSNYLLRSSAATALGKLGKHAELAVPALIKCLKDRERYVRNHAVTALGNLGEHARSAVPALTEYLEDVDIDDTGYTLAAEVLRKLGKKEVLTTSGEGNPSKRRRLNDDPEEHRLLF